MDVPEWVSQLRMIPNGFIFQLWAGHRNPRMPPHVNAAPVRFESLRPVHRLRCRVRQERVLTLVRPAPADQLT